LTSDANAGFSRSDAHLAIILVTDEDDCSMLDSVLMQQATDVFGPLQSFRCTAQGVECAEEIDTAGIKTDCRSRADSAYHLQPDTTACPGTTSLRLVIDRRQRPRPRPTSARPVRARTRSWREMTGVDASASACQADAPVVLL
jgi:hypothetical protein